MPTRRRRRLSHRPRSSYAGSRIEHLERRLLLDTGARHSFAQVLGDIPTSFAVRSFSGAASEQARFLAAAGVLDRVIGDEAPVLAAKPRKPAKPIVLPLKLVESPGASGAAVISGKLTARAKLKLDIGANGSIEQTVKANKKGVFQFTFHVGYGTTPVEVIGPNSGKRPRIGELNVVRRDTTPPLLSISAPHRGRYPILRSRSPALQATRRRD